MGDAVDELLEAFELHEPSRIAPAVALGVDVRAPLRGQPAFDWLLGMYARSERLPECVRVLLAHGAALRDVAVLPVLLDDAAAIAMAAQDPTWVRRRVTLPCAYTPLQGVSLLHVAVEFGHVAAVRALLAHGADVDDRAAVDADALGGQTPLFHAVNAYDARTDAVVALLLAAGARTDVQVAGLCWGRGFDWETALFDLTPIAYAQCGLLPQMHRDERAITARVQRLLAAAGRRVPPMGNVPNRYLRPKGKS